MKDTQGFSENLWTSQLDDGRNMQMLANFCYTSADGEHNCIIRDDLYNGGSIPRPLWPLIGSPYTGKARKAFPIHDKMCADAAKLPTFKQRWVARLHADKILYEMCRFLGIRWTKCAALYSGVRIGALSVLKRP
jgi:hypothetical protein